MEMGMTYDPQAVARGIANLEPTDPEALDYPTLAVLLVDGDQAGVLLALALTANPTYAALRLVDALAVQFGPSQRSYMRAITIVGNLTREAFDVR
jgi:hypothetical protein